MSDMYADFKDLAVHEKRNHDYQIRTQNLKTDIAIIAPHGGGIEPGTSELAIGIAGTDWSYYCFEGIKMRNNNLLHITSTNFDEPELIDLYGQSNLLITIHGADDEDAIVYVGGLFDEIISEVIDKLNENGFTSIIDSTNHSGRTTDNICNKGKLKNGVQFEISKGLREKMFQSLNRRGRVHKTCLFYSFIHFIRSTLLKYNVKS